MDLTTKEFDLLAYLAARPGHVFSREQLLNAVWRSASEWQQPATVTEHVRRLRNKIEADPHAPTLLVTVRGAGYRLDLPTVPSQTTTAPPPIAAVIHVGGRIVFADDEAADLVGAADPASLVGRDLLDLVAPTSRLAARERQADIEADRPRRSEIMHLRRDDGELVRVAVSSAPADWHGDQARRVQVTTLTDESDRLRELFTGVLADVVEAVIITDLHSHIRSWNTAAERIYGWAEDAVLGRHLLDVLQWAGHEAQLVTAWEQLERTGRWNGTVVQVARDGSTVDIVGSDTLLRDHTGAPIGVISVNRTVELASALSMLELDAALATRVEQGIADDEFVVHYQPIIDLVDGHVLGVEALVRWEHPERGTLFPPEFLGEAERTGLIVPLGELVLDKACRQVAEWRRSGADIGLSVNVSARQLSDPGLAERFAEIIRASGFDPDRLWLELTETALVEELDTASRVLWNLAELGVGVSIDDFGTGWASLTYLQSFPVRTLKIDSSFVAGMERPGNDIAIIRSILSLAAELGLFVVAEGIETGEQQRLLGTMGCTAGQGYFFARPMPASEVPVERARRIVHAVAGDAAGGPPRTRRARSVGGFAASSLALSAPPEHARTQEGLVPIERMESDAVAGLLRGLLRVASAPAAVELLQDTILRLGGRMVPAATARDDALPIDVALGEGSPVLVEVEPFSVTRMQLERLLPRLVEDARHAVDLLRRTERLQDETLRDGLTGLGNRRILDRVLPRATTGSVVLLDLDHFKLVNDEHGHAAGDEILRAFGSALGAQVRAQDTTCRIGGEEFAIVLADVDVAAAVALVERLRDAWSADSPRSVTFSAGVAAITPDGATAALLAADRAMYRAKDQGRNRTVAAPATFIQDDAT